MERLGAASIVAKLAAVYEDPKSWTVTGAKGIFAYPQGETAEDVVEKSIGASVKVIVQSLLRLVLGI